MPLCAYAQGVPLSSDSYPKGDVMNSSLKQKTQADYQEAVNRVIEAAQANLAEDWTPQKMAEIALYSKFHFIRVFKEVTGATPRAYVTRLRLAEAKRLLESTSRYVTDICLEVGFKHPNNFGASFRRVYGITPSKCREDARHQRELAHRQPVAA